MITTLDRLDHLEPRPLYVLVAGGIASGKNHVFRQHVRTLPVMDIDDVMEELGLEDYEGADFARAMKIIAARIEAMMARGESLVAMGTAASLGFSIDRLLGAKLLGYTTALVHVDAPVEQALAQNEERRLKGKRHVKPAQLDKIARTADGAARTVAALKDTRLVDFFVHHPNLR